MNEQIRYITKLAAQYEVFAEQSDALFDALNELDENALSSVYKEYGDSERYQPVNLLRAETARQLLDGVEISKRTVEEIKERLRARDLEYFAHLAPEFLTQIAEYKSSKKDLFASWQKDWSIFHTFFYRGKTKETVQIYLEQIGNRLLQDLELSDYAEHSVDFQGANNFGKHFCWLALYPQNKSSHKEAYQFFLRLGAVLEAGKNTGSNIEKREEITQKVETYEEVLNLLQEMKPEIVKLNSQIRGYFKFAPGRNAVEWENFKALNVIAVDYDNLPVGDISAVNSLPELNDLCGYEATNNSFGGTWHLWLFKSAQKGDVVFASRGTSVCLGIGIIEGDYYFDSIADEYKHRRRVKWITDKVYEYTSYDLKDYPKLFRADTFSPTLIWQFILSEYVRLYPELKGVFDENNLRYDAPTVKTVAKIEPPEAIDEPRGEINFWWLNANPTQWKISDFTEGNRQTYTSRNEKGNKRRVYKYFESVKLGDLIIGYESSPTKQVKAIFEITKPLHQSEIKGEVIEFELIEKLEIPVFWSELQNNAGLKNCEVFINNQGSLFKLTEEEYDIIREVIDSKNIAQESRLSSSEIKPYSFKEDPDKPFISENDFLQAVELLRRKKNIILQGAPGVGKTFIARKIAYELLGVKNDAQIEMVQFHQSYSYEDFIQGLRPGKNGFELRNGVFYTFCQQALAHPERQSFLIIDEINRGNLSKIFGELMMLIEADKRSDKFALKMTYAEDETDRFFVPPNLYIIGTMNTADRSLAIVDYALRRRFAFINLQPEFGDKFVEFLQNRGITKSTVESIRNSISRVNQEITNDINLGTGFQIGHSYFCTKNEETTEDAWLNEIITFEIKPLLEEIWFDDTAKVEEMMRILSA
jgi:5-methylcytosine-specific restriction protein B